MGCFMNFFVKVSIFTILVGLFLLQNSAFSQVTTSSISGNVTDQAGSSLIGATVKAVHEPTGTVYGSITKTNGIYRINNMRVGGPYTITVTYTGYAKQVLENASLRLGELEKFDFQLSEASVSTQTITVIAQQGSVGQNSGTSTQISTSEIEKLPTLDRNLNDFLRLTPQSGAYGGGVSIGGVNNRFNSIFVDGAVNNDVFGLASSGTNGGQTGISPFSLDIIDQLQVVVSPYDVTLSGFAGGGINAVTRSGSNEFKATVYQFFKNQSLVAKDNANFVDFNGLDEAEGVADFVERQIGGSISGPIIKDKLFFFTNIEVQGDETPVPYDVLQYTGDREGRYSLEQIQQLRQHVIDKYGYDPGNFGNTTDNLDGLKFFGKLNWNINPNHNLVLRHQYTNAEQYNRNAGSSSTINFENNGVYFPSTTNSTALELNSTFGSKYSNNLIIGYTTVRDNRDPIEKDFPYVRIDDGAGGSLQFGSEQFSTANQLDTDVLSITDNFRIYSGNHTFTVGTHNEFYSIYNLFLRQEYGFYRYANLGDFLNDAAPINYQRTYANNGDGAANFSAAQFGLYGQDEWVVNDKLTLSLGLRFDLPMINDNPTVAADFNSTALAEVRNFYDIANDTEGGKAPDAQIMISPRVGFTYLLDKINTRVRGGVGVFTSRIPFVWPGAMFTNNGINAGGVNLTGDAVEVLNNGTGYFNPDPDAQYSVPPGTPSGQIDLFTKDFKYPQVLRTSLGFDFELPGGIQTTIEGFFTKTLNNIVYTNINSNPDTAFTWTGSPDNRRIYVNKDINSQYSAIYLASNTNEGYTYSMALSLAKKFDFGLDAQLAYSYSDAYALSEGTSSQNSSQWRGQVNIDGRNNPELGRSDFAVGHRIVAALSYTKNWTSSKLFGTTLSLFMNAQSGVPFSYVIGGGFSAQNLSGERGSVNSNVSLAYIPSSQSDINLVDYSLSDGTVISAADQWTRLNTFIEEDSYLSNNRGGYSEKNGAWAPFTTTFDLSLRQDLGIKIQGSRNRIQLSFDIFNAGNLINDSWGTVYNVRGSFNNRNLYQFEGYEADGTTPKFTFRDADTRIEGTDQYDINRFASRWRAQFGIRYILN